MLFYISTITVTECSLRLAEPQPLRMFKQGRGCLYFKVSLVHPPSHLGMDWGFDGQNVQMCYALAASLAQCVWASPAVRAVPRVTASNSESKTLPTFSIFKLESLPVPVGGTE